MLSNHATEFVLQGYKSYQIFFVEAKRLIGGRGASRRSVKEVIIRNYDV